MSSYHKPKVFKSIEGCCICKAKSSSSRFTDSEKYGSEFDQCFQLEEARFGDICNACVLIVKRWRNSPKNRTKNWAHVVDARSGPGNKHNSVKPKLKKEPIHKIEHSTILKSKRKNKNSINRLSEGQRNRLNSTSISSFIDLAYWTRMTSCCGRVYRGNNGEIMIDQKHFLQCKKHCSVKPFVEEAVVSDKILLPKSKDFDCDVTERSFGDDDEDSLSFYSDTDSTISKFSHIDNVNSTDLEGDEGFFDKTNMRYLVQ